MQADNAWRPSALVGAAALKWRCVVRVLHDGVITLSKSLALAVLSFWWVGKIILWWVGGAIEFMRLSTCKALSNRRLVDFPSFRILSRRNIMKHYPTYMAWGIFWAIRITFHRNLLATSNSASWGTCCDRLTSELRYFDTLTFRRGHIEEAPT